MNMLSSNSKKEHFSFQVTHLLRLRLKKKKDLLAFFICLFVLIFFSFLFFFLLNIYMLKEWKCFIWRKIKDSQKLSVINN